MRKELLDQKVLAMYDVRGIQNYIFRTNYIKEIIGASAIVENIIIDGMRTVISSMESDWDRRDFLLNWEEQREPKETIFCNPEIKMQVLFIGGGNAYVMFQTGSICRQMNRHLAKYVLEHTYSLHLAVAVVEYTGSYQKDYRAINEKMREVKSRMPESRPLGALPFMAADPVTGFPYSAYRAKERKYVCTESKLKREKYDETFQEDAEKILDNMVTEKGDSSMLAVVHIDGNNMGKRIKEIMENKDDYLEAVNAMRAISINIRDGFREAFSEMAEYIDGKLSDRVKADREGKLYRKLILAGDDVTFICNSMIALDAVSGFLKSVTKRKMYQDTELSEEKNQKKYGFSACGGIAFFNSHFPFSDAYEVAEACCDSAKKRAKQECNRDQDGSIGNFLDYQICTHISAANLDTYREKHYVSAENGSSILMRPYYVNSPVLDGISDLNRINEKYDLEILQKSIQSFQKKMPRSQAKRLRSCCTVGNQEIERYLTFLRSRDVCIPETDKCYWYDALEMMDFYLEREDVWDDTKDKTIE